MGDIVKLARSTYCKDTQILHWRGCEDMHSDCMILKLANEVERLRAELASAERECSVRAERELGYLARAQMAEAALAAQPQAEVQPSVGVQACRPEDRAMLATPVGAELIANVAQALAVPTAVATAPAQPSGWIACAERMPASGVTVLACYRNRAGMHRTIMAIWVVAKSREGDDACDDLDLVYDEAADCYYWPEGWYEVMDSWPEYSYLVVSEGDVTYWMPLPAPPAPERAE